MRIKNKNNERFKEFSSRRLIYFANEGGSISSEELSSLKDKKEQSENQELDVDGLAKAATDVLKSYEDKMKDFPESFKAVLHDNIVQYFLTSAERFDKDKNKGLNKIEFANYQNSMIAKLNDLISQYVEKREKKEAAKKSMEGHLEAVNAITENAGNIFDEKNLDNPDNNAESIFIELTKFNAQTSGLNKIANSLNENVSQFMANYEEFQEKKLTALVSIFMTEPEDNLDASLQLLKNSLKQKIDYLKQRQSALAKYGERLNRAGDTLRQRVIEDRDNKLKKLHSGNKNLDLGKQENKEKYLMFSENKKALETRKQQMLEYRDKIGEQTEVGKQNQASVEEKKSQFLQYQSCVVDALSRIDSALSQDPPPEQRDELMAKKEDLEKKLGIVKTGVEDTSNSGNKLADAQSDAEKAKEKVEANILNSEYYLGQVIDPTIKNLQDSADQLEIAMLKNGNEEDKINGKAMEDLKSIDKVDEIVADNVFEASMNTEQMIGGLGNQLKMLDNVEVKPKNLAINIWDKVTRPIAIVGFGLKSLSETVFDGASEALEHVTKNIPVVDIAGKAVAGVLSLTSGVIEGASELVNGVGTLLRHPFDVTKGLGSLLLGYDPKNGEFLTGHAYKESWGKMVEGLVGYENFEKGKYGKAIGLAAFNIISVLAGVEAGKAAAEAGNLAYTSARAAGVGVLKAGMKFTYAVTTTFVPEFLDGLKSLPGSVLKKVADVLKLPKQILDSLSNAAPVQKLLQIQREVTDLTKTIDHVQKTIDKIQIGEMKISDIELFAGKSFNELAKLTPDQLALVLKDTASVKSFVKYKKLIQESHDLIVMRESRQCLLKLFQTDPQVGHIASKFWKNDSKLLKEAYEKGRLNQEFDQILAEGATESEAASLAAAGLAAEAAGESGFLTKLLKAWKSKASKAGEMEFFEGAEAMESTVKTTFEELMEKGKELAQEQSKEESKLAKNESGKSEEHEGEDGLPKTDYEKDNSKNHKPDYENAAVVDASKNGTNPANKENVGELKSAPIAEDGKPLNIPDESTNSPIAGETHLGPIASSNLESEHNKKSKNIQA